MALASGGTASTRGVREASFWVTAVRLQLFVEVDLERKLLVHFLKWF